MWAKGVTSGLQRHLALRSDVLRAAVSWGFVAVGHAVVAYHVGNAQAVVRKRAVAADVLCAAMLLQVAPRLDGLFIAKEL